LGSAKAGDKAAVPDDHQPLLLIQARNLITNLALPAFLTAPDGGLLFFNDAAAALLGRRFEEVGRLSQEEWAREVGPFDDEGRPLAADSLPLAEAMREGHPTQGRFNIRIEGGLREVDVSALPLLEPDNYEGTLIVFWPVEDAQPDTR
jgi:PAS domain-containing protein